MPRAERVHISFSSICSLLNEFWTQEKWDQPLIVLFSTVKVKDKSFVVQVSILSSTKMNQKLLWECSNRHLLWENESLYDNKLPTSQKVMANASVK